MRDLKEIVRDNKALVDMGVAAPGSLVGTGGGQMDWPQGNEETKGHSAEQGGLRGHSVGKTYPWSVVGLGTEWAVQNLLTSGYYVEGPSEGAFSGTIDDATRYDCDTAHIVAENLKERGV